MARKQRGQNVIGGVRPLPGDPARLRRSGAQAAAGQDIAAPLKLDGQGRRTLGLAGPLFTNAQGDADFAAGEGLEVTPGSRKRARVRLGDSMEFGRSGEVRQRESRTIIRDASGLMQAAPSTSDVLDQDPDVGTLAARLDRKANVADERFPFIVGTAVLVAGEVVISASAVAASSVILMSHRTIGGTPGYLSASIDAGVGFAIISTSAADTSEVSYAAWNP